jgi:hypothetical protein
MFAPTTPSAVTVTGRRGEVLSRLRACGFGRIMLGAMRVMAMVMLMTMMMAAEAEKVAKKGSPDKKQKNQSREDTIVHPFYAKMG